MRMFRGFQETGERAKKEEEKGEELDPKS